MDHYLRILEETGMYMTRDSAWKEILEHLFPDFLNLFFPEIYRDINFSKKYEFLDKELQKILKDARIGKRLVDKLVKVYLKDGSEKWLLIHVEVQGQPERNFSERMFIYNYRIFDRFHKEVITLVLLADADSKFRPAEFRIARWRFNLSFRFPSVKLLDFRKKWDKLEKASNPFALAVMAFLKTIETAGQEWERYSWKKNLLIELYQRGLTRETILFLYKFIDWIMEIPESLDDEIFDEIIKIERKTEMSVLTTAERIGRKRGLQEGRQKGLQEGLQEGRLDGLRKGICDVIELKFGQEGNTLIKKIHMVNSLETLETIREELKKAQTMTEAEEILNRHL